MSWLLAGDQGQRSSSELQGHIDAFAGLPGTYPAARTREQCYFSCRLQAGGPGHGL